VKPIRAVVLAGDNNQGEFIKGQKIKNKALLTIKSKPMLNYVLDVLIKVEEITEIVVVGPEELGEIIKDYQVNLIIHKEDIIDNVVASKTGWEDGRLLIVTSDIPMITVEGIKDFINQCNKYAKEYQLFYPIVAKAANERVFPGVKRTYVTLKEGVFTGGNVLMVDVCCIDGAVEEGKKLVALRKSPIKLANYLGWIFLMKLICKRLTICELEKRVSRLLNLKAKAIISEYPQLGTDVDKDSDIDIAEEYLQNIGNL
jgi:molybdopterin-guanine dinucleotide biosynthesis protein A